MKRLGRAERCCCILITPLLYERTAQDELDVSDFAAQVDEAVHECQRKPGLCLCKTSGAGAQVQLGERCKSLRGVRETVDFKRSHECFPEGRFRRDGKIESCERSRHGRWLENGSRLPSVCCKRARNACGDIAADSSPFDEGRIEFSGEGQYDQARVDAKRSQPYWS